MMHFLKRLFLKANLLLLSQTISGKLETKFFSNLNKEFIIDGLLESISLDFVL